MRAPSLTLLVPFVAALATAAEPVATGMEVRLMGGVGPNYAVEDERSPSGGGPASSYDWEGLPNNAVTVAGQMIWTSDRGGRFGRPQLGIELSSSYANMEPSGYAVAGTRQANAVSERMNYLTVSPRLVLGLRLTDEPVRGAAPLVELQFATGPVLARGEVTSSLGTDSSIGYGWDAGARAVFGIAEDGWSLGLMLGYGVGMAVMSFDGVGSTAYTSEMTLTRNGGEALVFGGCAF